MVLLDLISNDRVYVFFQRVFFWAVIVLHILAFPGHHDVYSHSTWRETSRPNTQQPSNLDESARELPTVR